MPDLHMLICPVCSNSKWIEAYKIKEWSVGECPFCGFARIDPLPAQVERPQFYSEEKIADRNVKILSPLQKFSRSMKRFSNRALRRDKSKIFYQKLLSYLPAGSSILDIGCGDGSFLNQAKKRFISSGIEISEYLAGLAQRKDGLKIMTGNFLDKDFGQEKYDGITLISLLEHLAEPEGALKKCFELLNDRGVLLLKTVNYGCLNRRIKKERWTGLRPPDHIVYFSPKNLANLLKKTGFRKIRISAWPFNDNMYCDCWK